MDNTAVLTGVSFQAGRWTQRPVVHTRNNYFLSVKIIFSMIVTQPLDLMKTISREQLCRDMGFLHSFRLESVLESTKKRTTAN